MSVKPYYDKGGITIYHGDCREILPTLEPVDLVLTDPPYGISDSPIVTQGRYKRRGDNDWHPKSDWDAEFPAWACPLVCAVADVVTWFGHWRMRGIAESSMSLPIRCEIVWAKDMHTSPPAPAAMQDERLWVFSKRGLKPRRFESTVWHEAVIPTWNHKWHKNQKPLSLMKRALRWLPGDSIVDPFMGSGTTLRAAKDLGRRAIGIEIEERYCEIAAKRLAQECLFT